MSLPVGTICLWAGAIVDIPAGFILCDGNNGTPDLRNRFVVGAGDTYAPDDSGGNANHNHDFTGDGHTHDILVGNDVQSGTGFDDVTDSAPATGTTDNASTFPPYYALAFIMRI